MGKLPDTNSEEVALIAATMLILDRRGLITKTPAPEEHFRTTYLALKQAVLDGKLLHAKAEKSE